MRRKIDENNFKKFVCWNKEELNQMEALLNFVSYKLQNKKISGIKKEEILAVVQQEVYNKVEKLNQPLELPYVFPKFNFSLIQEVTQYVVLPLVVCIFFLVLTFRVVEKIHPAVTVVFQSYQPTAQKVELVGDFTGWQPIKLSRKNGFWEIKVKLKPGQYRYLYIIDNVPQLDPAKEILEDMFGNKNSVIYV